MDTIAAENREVERLRALMTRHKSEICDELVLTQDVAVEIFGRRGADELLVKKTPYEMNSVFIDKMCRRPFASLKIMLNYLERTNQMRIISLLHD
jgi:hypothetical protein